MDKGERMKWRRAAVNARRAAFLSHIENCETCRTHLRGAISGRATCRELVPILRAYDQAQAFLAELLLPAPTGNIAAARASRGHLYRLGECFPGPRGITRRLTRRNFLQEQADPLHGAGADARQGRSSTAPGGSA